MSRLTRRKSDWYAFAVTRALADVPCSSRSLSLETPVRPHIRMAQRGRSGRKEGRLEAQGEQLLQSLVDHEKAVLVKVEDAKKEAGEIVAKAQSEAAQILERARKEADEVAERLRSEAEQESAAAREEVLERARAEVDRVEARAKSNRDRAVALIMERVLP